MNINLNIGKKTKWSLIGAALVILGLPLTLFSNSLVGLAILGGLMAIIGIVLLIAMLVVAIGIDFDPDFS